MIGIAILAVFALGQTAPDHAQVPTKMAFHAQEPQKAQELGTISEFEEKRLRITNPLDEPILIWVQFWSKSLKSPSTPETGAAVATDTAPTWRWSEVMGYILPPKAQFRLGGLHGDPQKPMQAAKVRLWAEGESGLHWNQHRSSDLWLIDENSRAGGKRSYAAESMDVFEYTFEPKSETRRFVERQLELHNQSDEKLTVQLQYRSEHQNEIRWRNLKEFTLEPGAKHTPLDENGLRVRASRFRISAIGESQKFEINAPQYVWTIDKNTSGRSYMSSRIGSLVYVLQGVINPNSRTISTSAPNPSKTQFASKLNPNQDAELASNALVSLDGFDESGFFEDSSSDADKSSWGDAIVWPLNLRKIPGVELNDPSDEVKTMALLKLAADAIQARADRSNLSGTLGRAFSITSRKYESQLKGELIEDSLITKLFDDVDFILGVNLTPKVHDNEFKEWRASRTDEFTSAKLDRNGDGQVADDLTRDRIFWLTERKLYNPASHVRLLEDFTGSSEKNSLALALSSSGLNPDWVKTRFPSDNMTPALVIPPQPIEVTTASARKSLLPTRMRLPDLTDLNVVDAQKQLVQRQLKIRWNFPKDRVPKECDFIKATNPKLGEWINAGSEVEWQVSRPVPDLKSLTLAQARDRLGKYGLKFDLDAKQDVNESDDQVYSQTPAANDRVEPGSNIKIQAARRVPKVFNTRKPEAFELVLKAGFQPLGSKNLADIDTITDQTPKPGEFQLVGSSIALTGHRAVPQVSGLTFSEARDQLSKWKIELDEESRAHLARPELRVFSQEPKGNEKIAIRPNDVSPMVQIKLKPGKEAPDLNQQPLDEVEQQIKNQDLGLLVEANPIKGVPMKIIWQDPPARSIMALGEKIRVRTAPVGVLVPKVTQITLNSALRQLKENKLGWDFPKDKAHGSDIVVSQNPKPYSENDPNWLKEGEVVQLEVHVMIPNVTKFNQGPRKLVDAKKILTQYGLEAQYPTDDLDEAAAVVVSQKPKEGELLPHGGKVDLDVRIPIPRVSRLSYTEANKLLAALKFKVDYDTEPLRDDYVISQTPAAEELALPGSEIKLNLLRKVPDLQGLSVAQATTLLEDRKFQVKLKNPDARPEDLIGDQSTPPSDEYVKPGSTIVIGKAFAKMPNLANKTIGEATALLENEGYQVKFHNGLQPEDNVTVQKPAPGARIERNDVVTLDSQVIIPKTLGLSVSEARDRLENLGITLDVFVQPQAREGDFVVEQFPKPGTVVRPRTEVGLTPGFRMPKLIGLEYANAKAELNNLGLGKSDFGIGIFRGNVSTTDPDKDELEIVVNQSIKPGTAFRRGDRIDIDVDRYRLETNGKSRPNRGPRE